MSDYSIGIDLGTTFTAAAVQRDGDVTMLSLGRRQPEMPSVVAVQPDDVVVGDAAERVALSEPESIAREFKRRIGDPVPIMVKGTPWSAEALTSHLILAVLEHAKSVEGAAPSSVRLTHPANWYEFKIDRLRQAAMLAGSDDPVLLTEPAAAARYYASQGRVSRGQTLAVFDLGGGTFDAAVVRVTDQSGFELLGRPKGLEQLGGIDLDHAVFTHVIASLDLDLADIEDTFETRRAVHRLRLDCRDAKESLSVDVSVSIPVMLPNLHTEVRLTRSEFETAVRPSLSKAVQTLGSTIESSGAGASGIDGVLLVGGSSRIPLVAQMIGEQLAVPVLADAHPKHAVASGAALSTVSFAEPSPVAAQSDPRGPISYPAVLETADLPPRQDVDRGGPEVHPSPGPAWGAEGSAAPEPVGLDVRVVSSEGSRRPPARTLLVVALMVVAAVVGGGLWLSRLGDAEVSKTDAPSSSATGDEGSREVVDLTQGGDLLLEVRDRGVIRCGVNDALPGFGAVDEAGDFSGFDVEFCRVIAAGVLGDSNAVEFVPLAASERFGALQGGDVDVLVRNTSWTASRDGEFGMEFLFTTFFDGQTLMVPASSGFRTLEDLSGSTVCVVAATDLERNLAAVFGARQIPIEQRAFEDSDQAMSAYVSGECDAWTSSASALGVATASIESSTGQPQSILAEMLSMEPTGPVIVEGDPAWSQAVEWSVMATIQAWEFGLDSTSISAYNGDDVGILRFIGGEAFDPGLGLSGDFAVDVVTQVGNYEELFERHLAPIGIQLAGSPNDLWTNGGLMYAPPYR